MPLGGGRSRRRAAASAQFPNGQQVWFYWATRPHGFFRSERSGCSRMEEQHFRIFISSPGDVGEERVIAGRVVDLLAGEFGQFLDLEAVLWEHEPLRATDHFQQQIIPPSKTDVVVCILWSRLGTRLPEKFVRRDGSPYGSGTEWEFEDAAQSYRKYGTPDLLVYRKTLEAVAGLSDKEALLKRLEQKEALDTFIERWFGSPDDSFKAAFHTFETADEFESLLEAHLRRLIESNLPEHLIGAEPGAQRIMWRQGSPFRGLSSFEFEHASVFFGRTRAVGEVKRAIAARAGAGSAFLMVFGMSGSGKSSLIRAGLLPTLSQPGVIEGVGLWRWCILRPGNAAGDLFDGLAQALLGLNALPELAELADVKLLASYFRNVPEEAIQPIGKALARAAEQAALAEGAVARLALVVDQMEELFTSEELDPAERASFITMLSALAQSGQVWVIGAMRSDFYHRCAEEPNLVALSADAGQYHLVPPSPVELAQIIRSPARAAGLHFEVAAETGDHLDDVLHASAARDPAALPLLQFTLEEMFKLRSEERVLTFEAYERLGGLAGALSRRAEEIVAGLDPAVQAALPAVFRSLVTVGSEEDAPAAARRISLDWVAAVPERKAVVDAFVGARLLVADRADDGSAVVRVAHEALLEHWPRLRAWLEEDREYLRARARVSAAAERWRKEGAVADLLLPEGKALAEGEALLARRDELDPEVVDYVEASLEAQRARFERAQAAHRRRFRIASVAAVVLGLLAIGAGVAGYLAYLNSIEAEAQRSIADSQRQKAQEAEFQALRDRSLVLSDLSVAETESGNATNGMLYALAALPSDLTSPDRPYLPDADSALYRAVYSHRELAVLRGHDGWVRRAAFSPEGTRIVTASSDLSARVWDVASGREAAVLQGHRGEVWHVAFGPKGDRVVSASKDHTARLWDAASGAAVHVLEGHDDVVWDAEFSPDGRRIVTASGDGTARLWDVENGTQIAVLHHDGGVRSARFSPDGTRVVTGAGDSTARLWDVESGAEIAVLRGHVGEVWYAAFSPDGTRVVTASVDKTARLWDAATNAEIATLRGHGRGLTHAAFSPDGTRLVTASGDRTAKLWDVAKGTEIATLYGHEDRVRRATFSPDGTRIVTASGDKTARLWDATTGAEIAVLRAHTAGVRRAEFSPDGQLVATASVDGTARLWDATRGGQQVILNHDGWVRSAAFSPLGHDRIVTASIDHTAKLWQATTGAELMTLEGHGHELTFAAYSPDGRHIVTTSKDRTARIWDAQSGATTAVLQGHEDSVWQAAYSADGRRLVTASKDRTARLWDPVSGSELSVLRHKGGVNSAEFSPDGTRVVTASWDKTARVWDSNGGDELLVLGGHDAHVWYAAFSPDGTRVVTVSADHTARLWDAVTGAEIARYTGHEGEVRHAAFTPDGTRLATVSLDRTARVWDLDSGAELAVLRGHGAGVLHVAFSGDGGWLVTAAKDRTARLWNAANGDALAVLAGHQGGLTYTAFSPDDSRIVTASDDGTARLWVHFPTTRDLIAFAQPIVLRLRTEGERQRLSLKGESESAADSN